MGRPWTSILPTLTNPPQPWPLPGVRSVKPISLTLLKSGLFTQVPLVTTFVISSASQRIDAIATSLSSKSVEFEEAAPSA